MGDELGRGHVGRQAVVLGHVAEQRPDRLAAGRAVAAEHQGLAAGRRAQAEQDLDQRGLARAVGTDQAGDTGGERDGKAVERGHLAGIHLGQRLVLDNGGLDNGGLDRGRPDDGGPGFPGSLDGWHGCYSASGSTAGTSAARVKLSWSFMVRTRVRICRAAYACRMTPAPAMTVYGGYVRTISDASPEAPPARPQVSPAAVAPGIPAIPAARPRPPLTKRLRPRQWAALDYVVGGIFGLILLATVRHGVVQAIESPYGIAVYHPLSLTWPLAVFLIVMAVVAVGMRRRRPVFMLGILLAGSVVVTSLTGPEVGTLAYFLPVAYVLYLVAATYEQRQAAVRVLVG